MTLEERLTKLEAENRRLKHGAAVCLVAVVAVLFMAQAKPTPQPAEASKFTLRDAQGRERLRLEVTQNDNPAINIFDQEGRLRSSLGLYGISFYDDNGRMRTTLMSDLLYMSDERAHEIAHLYGDMHGAELLLFSGLGSGSTVLRADPSGSQLRLTGSGRQKLLRPGE
ncbi:MAG TPA: hypothetical protein VL177_00300 [Terriglobales bacterium]|jgi:hypothetical protein|nr:hypothetical protein [Terriglobales bacterium]